MKTIEVKQLEATSVWYEGRERLCVNVVDSVTQQTLQLVMDWSEGCELVIECLTTLAFVGLDPVAQKLVQFLFESAQEIGQRNKE